MSIVTLLCFVSCKNIFEKNASDYPLNELTVISAVVDGTDFSQIDITFDGDLTQNSYYWDFNGDKLCDFSQLYYIPGLTPKYSDYNFLNYSQNLKELSPMPTTIYFNTSKDFYEFSAASALGTKIERFRIKTSSATIVYPN